MSLASSDDIVTIGLDRHPRPARPTPEQQSSSSSYGDAIYAAELRRYDHTSFGGSCDRHHHRMLDNALREKAFLQQELQNVTRMFASLVRSLSEAVQGSPSETVDAEEPQPAMPVELASILHGNTSLLEAHEQPPVSSCVVQHPGALCCTSTTIAKDAVHKVAIINLRTVARLSDDPEAHQSLTMDDLTGLATQAMSNSANDVCREHARTLNRAVLGTERLDMHQRLCHTLQTGSIAKVCDYNVSQFGHKSFKLQLRDANTGHTYVHAVYCPLLHTFLHQRQDSRPVQAMHRRRL